MKKQWKRNKMLLRHCFGLVTYFSTNNLRFGPLKPKSRHLRPWFNKEMIFFFFLNKFSDEIRIIIIRLNLNLTNAFLSVFYTQIHKLIQNNVWNKIYSNKIWIINEKNWFHCPKNIHCSIFNIQRSNCDRLQYWQFFFIWCAVKIPQHTCIWRFKRNQSYLVYKQIASFSFCD